MQDFEALSAYDYTLPEELIAKTPLSRRDASRLLVVRRAEGVIEHCHIGDLPDLLQPHDLLVMNDSKVLPARLTGTRARTGGRWEGLFLGTTPDGRWRLIGQTRGRLKPGEDLSIPPSSGSTMVPLLIELQERDGEGGWFASPRDDRGVLPLLECYGQTPLPPYMERDQATPDDAERYQTVYARTPGSVAAPTAGLHFTPDLLQRLEQRGIRRTCVTLHVGLGTFRPVNVERIADHVMHSEWCEVTAASGEAILHQRQAGRRVVAVGTTSLRTLESWAQQGPSCPWSGETRLFIRPPYEFQRVDCLLTNFHLPKSTLLMLVSAFGGYDLIRDAYAIAVEQRYRFFSFGDAMLIL